MARLTKFLARLTCHRCTQMGERLRRGLSREDPKLLPPGFLGFHRLRNLFGGLSLKRARPLTLLHEFYVSSAEARRACLSWLGPYFQEFRLLAFWTAKALREEPEDGPELAQRFASWCDRFRVLTWGLPLDPRGRIPFLLEARTPEEAHLRFSLWQQKFWESRAFRDPPPSGFETWLAPSQSASAMAKTEPRLEKLRRVQLQLQALRALSKLGSAERLEQEFSKLEALVEPKELEGLLPYLEAILIDGPSPRLVEVLQEIPRNAAKDLRKSSP